MMQVATVHDNQPWCCSVFYAPSKTLELYWVSLPDTRHSRELTENANVAVTIPIRFIPGKPVVGISAEGSARLIDTAEEVEKAIKQYAAYLDRGSAWAMDFIAGKNPHKLYCFTPQLFVLFDAEHFPENPRQELRR